MTRAHCTGCTGDCEAGTRDCTCGHAVIGMWDIERQHPWRWAAIYAVTVVLSLLAAHGSAQGWW